MQVTDKITITNEDNPDLFCIFKEQNRNGLQSETVSNIHIKRLI